MRVTILSWNIKCGSDKGPINNGWPKRKQALKAALANEYFDILSVQEGLSGQLDFLQDCLPGFERQGVGRTDGNRAGEHCAIYFSQKRFGLRDAGTFWLSPTPGRPSRSWDPRPLPPRICSWVLLEEKERGEKFRIFNTHFPLTGPARKKSASVLIEQMARIHPKTPVILTGDFNSRPGSVPRQIIEDSGFINAESYVTRNGHSKTWHVGGVGLVCLDAIFAGGEWMPRDYRLVRSKSNGTHPSDHFGIAADMEL